MINSFDFYFDFISPYSFLAHKEIKIIERRESIKIRYKPILLGGLHNLHGIKAPAFIPAKAKHMVRDCKLIAEKKKIKFKFNSYFPIKSLNLMRGVIVAEEDNYKSYYIDNIFNSVWQDGLNMNDENIIEKVLKNLNVNPKTFLLRSTSSSIKDSLKKRTSEAYEKGVFGAPSFISNNKVFWGQDRIEFALNEAKK
ncbi:2-hydroxychromene-2-carboxylate isomerase [Pelagibacteraceae bacterium]|jgi:2-hydroxychromene-2-carboxylate isomerase|nr:2-hydroxychromene-2-carboxylate isomerase [Pelagibacteraceae bacterium]MDB9743324.1 2-hydroxychromene-2-carboxylate isomerase [Pelagibacteraceae bacterium]MDC0340144.1 2-hydroxychromene-2-carboxylate isomerase [Pelagibacteraceae bacterium]MDC0365911.1 2-hydroxychromene-2-carboxylate isomerase [Pelagibacteraceae bacterium]MDC3232898.1 2-hydroxychromene-2-carboxylate isomerase [Pelagibacteraceae bacterium]|tara:strand:+ start:122 stop:709 length:588 start_codon:yes stop_codon:yes gene_type:complete